MREGRAILGRVVWRELTTPEPEKAKAFYADLFGWTYEEAAPGAGTTLRLAGQPLGAIRQAQRVGFGTGWVSFVSVDNVDASVVIASADGGGALPGLREVPGLGRVARVVDYAEAMLAAVKSPPGTPVPPKAEVGAFCWETLITPDVARAKEFYGKVFGWRMQSAADGSTVFAADSTPAGQVASAEESPDARQHWRTHLRVENLDATREHAVRLGAKVLVPRRAGPAGGSLAVLTDPTGVEFGLLEPARPS
ncbi:VOC family protein [Corallococcus exercitus]|uniref:VOC family protein n=1 Tax=Corallococcus exercitus TaxID=2316736 RepID=UPI0035D4D21F